MNRLETAVPFMKQLEQLLTERRDKLNADLKAVGIKGVDLDTPLLRIREQIASAETKYTIAFVGTFKTGKSTIINSLLNLQGNARLSSEFDPDTAKCIRLLKKEKRQRYDAEVIFADNAYPPEHISWQEAKKYTSQVALDQSDSSFIKKAEKVEEVRYYIDHPFLEVCNILDLPGTGTGAHSEHTDVTDRKIMEADCIFWVVSTDAEPDSESILNLEKFNTKMLPIINVWQSEQEDIYSSMTPEEIVDMLQSQFEAYFASCDEPVIYYAREIDLAQQENRELKEEWGKAAFTEKVEAILSNIQSGDRMTRIKNQIRTALETYDLSVAAVLDDKDLIAAGQAEKNESYEIRQISSKLRKASDLAQSEIKEHAKKVTQEILEIFTDASDAFIENQMQGMNWKALFSRRSAEEDLKSDFANNYARINSGWLDQNISEFSGDVMSLLTGIYSDFAMDLDNIQNVSGSFSMGNDSLSGFIEDMSKLMSKDMANRIVPTLLAVIGGGIMLAIPGGAVFEAFATVVVSGITATTNITADGKLRSKVNGMKTTAKVQIRQQRAGIVEKLKETGKQVNEEFCNKINEEIDKRRSANEQKIEKFRKLEDNVKEVRKFIAETTDELEAL